MSKNIKVNRKLKIVTLLILIIIIILFLFRKCSFKPTEIITDEKEQIEEVIEVPQNNKEDIDDNVIEEIIEKDIKDEETKMSFWVVFYDQYGNELQREILEEGSVPSYKQALPNGFIKWVYKNTNKDVDTFKPITSNQYFIAVCNTVENSSKIVSKINDILPLGAYYFRKNLDGSTMFIGPGEKLPDNIAPEVEPYEYETGKYDWYEGQSLLYYNGYVYEFYSDMDGSVREVGVKITGKNIMYGTNLYYRSLGYDPSGIEDLGDYQLTLKKARPILESICGYTPTDITSLFGSCVALEDISEFKIPEGVKHCGILFSGCEKLTDINITIPSSVIDLNYMFKDCVNMRGNVIINAPVKVIDSYSNTALGMFDDAGNKKASIVISGTSPYLDDIEKTNEHREYEWIEEECCYTSTLLHHVIVKDKVYPNSIVTFDTDCYLVLRDDYKVIDHMPYQIDPIEVAWGEKIVEPIIPTYNGLHIEGYYKDVDEDYNYIDKWNFDTDEVFEDMKLYIKSEYVPCERQDDLYLIEEIENNTVYYTLFSYNQEEDTYEYVSWGEAPLEEMKQAFGVDNIELFFYHSDGSKCYYGYDHVR